jgi:predicted MFS family arabinose efflux permease
MRRQLSLLADPRLMLALLTTVIGFGGQIVAYTYIAPFLEHVSGFGAGSISPLLVVFGSAAAAGTFAGGHAIDRWPRATPVLALGLLAGVLGLATLTAESTIGAIATLVAWGSVGFALSPVLQHQAARAAPHSPDIVSALNISAFNFGIAGGALIGGRVVAGDGIHAVTWVGGLIVAAAALLAAVGALTARPQAAAAARSLSP